MAYQSQKRSKVAQIEPDDTLETIAERERAEGNDITAEDIARFNWGTEDPEQIQELLRDELGATQREVAHEFLLSPDLPGTSKLEIPEPFVAERLPVNRRYQLQVVRKKCPKQFLGCSGLSTGAFDFDSSFLRPEAKAELERAQELVDLWPEAMLFAFGHTDAVGTDEYNKRLSERRAWAVQSFLIGDPDAWETLYKHPDENWGVTAIQEMLASLGHEPGDADGDLGPQTRAAMRSLLGLPDDAKVDNDAEFRRELFTAYMNGPDDAKVPPDRFVGDGFMGCGELNLAEATDAKNDANRRVTVFAFHRDRLPKFPCAFDNLAPCRARFNEDTARYNPGFSCSFYDTIAEPCHAENEQHSLSLLLRTYPVDIATVNKLMDEYVLRSQCGKLGVARKAMSAGTRDETWLELRWERIRAHMKLTMLHRLGEGERVLLADVPYGSLVTEGHVTEDGPAPPPPTPTPEEPVDPNTYEPEVPTGLEDLDDDEEDA